MNFVESADREIAPGVGPGKDGRSLAGDVSYDVSRILLRRFFVPIISWAVTTFLVFLCGWLMWRGCKSFFGGDSPQPSAEVQSAMPQGATAEATTEVPAALAATGIGAPTVLAFLLAILLLPVVTISFIRTMVSKRSNGVNALTLAIYTAADFILSFFMVGASLETVGKAVVFMGMGVFSLIYNFTVMNYALKLEDGR